MSDWWLLHVVLGRVAQCVGKTVQNLGVNGGISGITDSERQ